MKKREIDRKSISFFRLAQILIFPLCYWTRYLSDNGRLSDKCSLDHKEVIQAQINFSLLDGIFGHKVFEAL